jgi:hypothetical protein
VNKAPPPSQVAGQIFLFFIPRRETIEWLLTVVTSLFDFFWTWASGCALSKSGLILGRCMTALNISNTMSTRCSTTSSFSGAKSISLSATFADYEKQSGAAVDGLSTHSCKPILYITDTQLLAVISPPPPSPLRRARHPHHIRSLLGPSRCPGSHTSPWWRNGPRDKARTRKSVGGSRIRTSHGPPFDSQTSLPASF